MIICFERQERNGCSVLNKTARKWVMKRASDCIGAAHALLCYCTFIGLSVVGISWNLYYGTPVNLTLGSNRVLHSVHQGNRSGHAGSSRTTPVLPLRTKHLNDYFVPFLCIPCVRLFVRVEPSCCPSSFAARADNSSSYMPLVRSLTM